MKVPRLAFIALIFVAFASIFIFASISVTTGDPTVPGPYGDTQDYDGIAFQLAHGRGFGIDYSDAEWRKPYEMHNEEGEYQDLLSRHTPFVVSTYRPPMLPYLLAISYRVFGRNFLAWRIVQSLFTAFALALICDVAWRAFGSGVALIAAGVMFVSRTYIRYVAIEALLTEPLALLFIACLIWSIAAYADLLRTRDAVFAGIAFALLCLTRSFFIPWLPFIALLIWWIGKRSAWRHAVMFLVVAIAIQTPWAIRNIRATHAFMPFGTQGGVEMYTGYGDYAVLHRGIWWVGGPGQAERAFVKEMGGACSGCDRVALARYETRGARIWAREHIAMLPKLAYWKVANSVTFADEAGFIAPLFLLALFAPMVLWRRRAAVNLTVAFSCAMFVVLTFAVIALTWSMGWRFIVPVEPLIAIAAAIPIAAWIFGDSEISKAA